MADELDQERSPTEFQAAVDPKLLGELETIAAAKRPEASELPEPEVPELAYTDEEWNSLFYNPGELKVPDLEQGYPTAIRPIEDDPLYQRVQAKYAALQQHGYSPEGLQDWYGMALTQVLDRRLDAIQGLPAGGGIGISSVEYDESFLPRPRVHGEFTRQNRYRIDTNRIVGTGSIKDWSGRDSGLKDVDTSLGRYAGKKVPYSLHIMSIAKAMLMGTFSEEASDRDPINVTMNVAEDGEYFYKVDGGQDRVAALKLLGRPTADVLLMDAPTDFKDTPRGDKLVADHIARRVR